MWRRRYGLSLGLLIAALLLGAQAIQSATTPKGESKLDAAMIDKRLTQILENQRAILKKLDAISEELRIIKVRATN